MASKVHVESIVDERRLRRIYDWLDNGNNKKALQEIHKVLKKHPNNQCVQMLKALALLRLGKEDECQVIMDKVRSKVPCDDSTLQVMSICYREIHQPNKISEVYEAAVKADPNNEELLTHLFMSYVRLGDYKKQQQTAFALYKLKPKNPYYFWAVMSIVMQAIHADEILAKTVILPLAERMVVKIIEEGKMEAEQEVQLYLMILKLQDKSDEMLNVLSGPLALHLSPIPQCKAALLSKLERFSEAASAYKELISENTDNWAYYQDYLFAALKFQKPEECLDFFDKIISTSEKKVRAPYLAKLELFKRTQNKGVVENAAEAMNIMHQYFSQFGEKDCVVQDLRLYLNLLTHVDKLQLLRKIENDVGVKPEEFPTTVSQMQKHIHLEQLRRICGLHHSPNVSINEQKQLVERLCKLYEKGNELCPIQERLPTDFCPADSYILLTTHLLHELWSNTDEASYLYRAMSILERGLASSPANFHMKILLIRIYLEAGLVGAADHVFTLLDVKHIQLDSLGYLLAPMLAPFGHLFLASATLDHSNKFFVANCKDSADHLTFAYKYGSFVKIQEFVELRERLEKSIHFVTTTMDKMLLELSLCDSLTSLLSTVNNIHIQPDEDTIHLNSLRDNRDLKVVCGWEPLTENEVDPRMQEETRECMLKLLAARSLILKILLACGTPDFSSLLNRLSAELKELDNEQIPLILEKFESEGKKNKPCKILVPMDAVERLREAHYSEQLKTIARLAESLSQSGYLDFECIEMLRTSPCLQTIEIPEKDVPVSFKHFLLRASTCSESLAVISAICTMCATQLQPRISQKKNKKKCCKEIESLSMNDNDHNWKDISTLLVKRIQALDTVLTEFEKYQLNTGLNNSEDDIHATILKYGQASLGQSCGPLKSRAQITLKLLNSLKS
nr:N-alpha-acetyltransferase 25, NatB auxiliary subunit [Nomia melanderi]XP_031835023.1 N-alpha-acetyltransferase 25, NatB auxiliary subunit [Nomia melanderi]XP_031835024.1 N-alpha-acetyltransferase 25, NatB auxiliary subunit [Nomia melanderi]